MMRQSQTAVLERSIALTGEFTTEPFEVGWAAEARWWVKLSGLDGDRARVSLVTQISPDGLVWVDLEDAPHEATQAGLVTWPVREFGQWLRLRGTVDGADAPPQAMIYLSLKS